MALEHRLGGVISHSYSPGGSHHKHVLGLLHYNLKRASSQKHNPLGKIFFVIKIHGNQHLESSNKSAFETWIMVQSGQTTISPLKMATLTNNNYFQSVLIFYFIHIWEPVLIYTLFYAKRYSASQNTELFPSI